eukprot:1207724-Amphidinium_carterae.1
MSSAAESAKIEASIDEVATQIDCVGGKAQDPRRKERPSLTPPACACAVVWLVLIHQKVQWAMAFTRTYSWRWLQPLMT